MGSGLNKAIINMLEMTLTKSQGLLYLLIKKLGEVDDKIKLAKYEYFADFIHHAFNSKPISDESSLYERREYGPLSVSFNSDLEHLIKMGLIESKKKYHYSVKKKVKLDLDDKELRTIEYVLNKYSDYSYDVLTDISHKQIPYLSANDGGIIDYNTAYNLVDEYPDYVK